MKTDRVGKVFFVIQLSLLSAAISANPITVEFDGYVSGVSPSLSGFFSVSQVIHGSYTFESTTPDSEPDGNLGSYQPLKALTYSIGGYAASVGAESSYIAIVNAYEPPFVNDVYSIYDTAPVGQLVAGFSPTTFFIELTDPAGYALESDALPRTAPDLTAFNSTIWVMSFGSSGNDIVQGFITSMQVLKKDPCTTASNAVIESARAYQKTARDVPSVCADPVGECNLAEANSDGAMLDLTSAHEAMLAACGSAVPPPPPAQSPSLFGDLVINELMIDPAGISDAQGEWIELYNPTAIDFELSGLTFRITSLSGATQEFIVNSSVMVPAREFVVLGKSTDPSWNGGVDVDYVASFSLPNGGDFSLEVSNGTTLIDSVSFVAVQVPNGQSYQLHYSEGAYVSVTNAVDNDDLSNWCPAFLFSYGTEALNYGSPGGLNHPCY